MENNTFSFDPPSSQSKCNCYHVGDAIDEDFTEFDDFVNRMLHSPNNYYQDNHEQIILDGPNDELFDPMSLLCDEIMDNPSMEDIFSEPLALVQVNGNNNHNNDTIVVHNDGNVHNQQVSYHQHEQEQDREQEFALEEPLPLQAFDNSLNYDCSQVLREIIHTNGAHTTKLLLYGFVGHISHAILEQYDLNPNCDDAPGIKEYQMIDFSKESNNTVKEYLKKHFENQRQRGCILWHDHLSTFYEALSIGYDWLSPNFNSTPRDHQASTSALVVEPLVPQEHHGKISFQVAGSSQMHHHRHKAEVHRVIGEPLEPNKDDNLNALRTDLAVQRERTKTMVVGDFAKYFDIPLKQATKELYLCDTVVKKKLRSFGIPRWPYRKVQGMKRRISKLSRNPGFLHPLSRPSFEIEIRTLQHQIDQILSGNMDVISRTLS